MGLTLLCLILVTKYPSFFDSGKLTVQYSVIIVSLPPTVPCEPYCLLVPGKILEMFKFRRYFKLKLYDANNPALSTPIYTTGTLSTP